MKGQISTVAADDRGLNYADGFFTTILVLDGDLQLWPLHAQRLQQTAECLYFPSLNLEAIQQEASTIAQSHQQSRGVLKILITRGSGGRGYAVPESPQIQIRYSLSAYPDTYLNWQQQGIHLGLSSQKLASMSIGLNLKTTGRLEQVLLKHELATLAYDDLVCLNQSSKVIETISANLYWRCGSVIYSSDLGDAGIAGVMRQHLILQLESSPYTLQLGVYDISALAQADEIFISNCLMQFVPVRQWQDRILNDFSASIWFLKSSIHA